MIFPFVIDASHSPMTMSASAGSGSSSATLPSSTSPAKTERTRRLSFPQGVTMSVSPFSL